MTAAIVTTTADLLDRAADLIAENGLAYRDYAGKDGCLCVRGAFHVAAGQPADTCGLETIGTGYDCVCVAPSVAVADYLGMEPPVYGDGEPAIEWETDAITNWNDGDGMTAAEVVDTLRAAARVERSRGDS